MNRLSSFLGTLAAAALVSGPALANTEIITAYDARAAGMGHTGAATINNAAAIFTNPANLTDITHLDVTLHFSPDFTSAKTPYISATAPTAETTSNMLLTPLAFVGVAYRLPSGVALGLAANLTQVKGVIFKDTPLTLAVPQLAATPLAAATGNVSAGQLFWEVRAPVAVDITRWLTVSAGYRMGFFYQSSKISSPALPVNLTQSSEQGRNFAGAQAAISIKPRSNLRFGLTYRSKMVVLGSGHRTALDLTTQKPATSKIRNDFFASPHMFTVGGAIKLLDNRLTLAGDFKYWMYKDAYSGHGDYRDAMSGHVGGEYMVTPRVPVRAGYLIGLSATRRRNASPVDTTPGLQHGGTIGSGYHFDWIDLDAAVGVGGSSTEVTQSTTAVGGSYKLLAVLANVSATFHL